MRSVGRWVAIGVIVFVVAVAVALLALPAAVRILAVRELTDVTGRPTAIGDVDLNLFTRHLVVRDVRVSDGDGRPPVAELGRLDARVQLASLLQGRLDLDALTLDAPVVRIRRDQRGLLNVADIVQRFLSRPAGQAGRFTLKRFTLDRGHLVFEDHRASPAYTWDTTSLRVTASDLGTDVSDGRLSLAFDVAGAHVAVELERLAVRPFSTRFRVAVDGFDARILRSYLPPDAAVVPSVGRVTLRADGRYDVSTGLVASGETRLTDVALARPGATGPFLTAPALTLTGSTVTWAHGVAAARRIEITGTPVLLDRRVEPPRRLDITPFRLVLDAVRHPALEPARVSIAAGLPDGARFDVTGTAAFMPAAADLTVALTGVNLALARPFLPADVTMTPEGGTLGGDVRILVYSGGVVANGGFSVTDLAVGRPGQTTPFARDPLVRGTLANLTLRDGNLAAGEIAVTGTPSIVDERNGVQHRFDLTDVAARVRDFTWPPRGEATIELDAALTSGGTASVRGTLHPGTLSARMRAELNDLDLTPFAPYLPPDAPVGLRSGRATGRARLRHERATGARIGSRVRLTDLVLLRPRQTEPLLTATNVELSFEDLLVKDGALSLRQATLGGAPRVTDVSTGTPQQFDVSRLAAQVRDFTWPVRNPAGVSLDVILDRGGGLHVTGSVHPATLDADTHVTLIGVDLTRFTPYLPADAVLALGGGRVTGNAHLRHDRATGVRLDGAATLNDLVLVRRGQSGPFAIDPSLDVSVRDLVARDGVVRIGRARIAGSPRVIEASGYAPQEVEFASLTVLAENAAWPGPSTIAVKATGVMTDGATSTLEGSVTLPSLTAEARATFAGVDLTRINAYLPPDAVRIHRGRLEARVELAHERATGVTLTADGAVTDLAVVRAAESEAFFADRRLTFAVDGFTIHDTAYAIRRITVNGAPDLVDASVSPPRRLTLRALSLVGDDLASRRDQPGRLTIDAQLPEAGTMTVRGTANLEARTVDADVALRDAAIAPFTPFLPVSTDVRGRMDAALTVRATIGERFQLTGRGALRARDVAVGPAPSVSLRDLEVTGLDLAWPQSAAIDAVTIRQPYALLERAEDGSFPLRAMLSARSTTRADGTVPTNDRGSDPFEIRIGTVTVEDADLRFVDRTVRPSYSEEVTQLTVSLRNLANGSAPPAALRVQGVVAGNAALDLTGTAAPFGDPFSLDVGGELRDFPIVRTNPYMQRFLDWFARSGRLTTRFHYRIEGDRLQARNDILVQRLALEPARDGSDRLVGLPLGLVVSLLKDTRGDIRLTVPVEGRLSAPEFSYGDALGTAVKNIMARLATAPFRAVGDLFGSDDDGREPEVKITPVVFAPASAELTPGASKHLQRVADVLRSSPNVKLGLAAVIGRDDLVALRAQRTTARIQRLQRERKLDDFAAAARELYTTELPGSPAPATTGEIVSAIAAASPQPDRATQRLVTRRLAAARQALIELAGIAPERILPLEAPPTVGDAGEGRIEFTLLPS